MLLNNKTAALNARYRHHSATSVLQHALHDPDAGRLAMVSSFGAESVVLLHMLSVTRRDTPVIFIDTEMLFTETVGNILLAIVVVLNVIGFLWIRKTMDIDI